MGELVMPKTLPLCTSAKSNLGDRVFSDVERIALLLYQAERDTEGSCLKNHVSRPGRIWGGVL